MTAAAKIRYVVRAGDMPSYSPANHAGTRNTRLVSQALNGARFMEVVLGEVDKGAGVSTHAHPGMETMTANVLGGPFASMVDRVRDALK